MRTRPIALLSAALSLLTGRAAAQAFEPGYVVRLAGDTLRGEIENHHWEEPPTSIRFRAGSSSPVATFRPGQLRAVRLGSGRYFRADVLPVDRGAETELRRLPRGLAFNQKPDSVLAEVLVEGPATLLRMQLAATHYFVRREQQPYLELTERRYLREVRGGLLVTDANNYRAQLSTYFGDCAAVTGQLHLLDFTAPALTGLIQAYNRSCSAAGQAGQEYLPLAQPRRKVSWQFGLRGGLRLSGQRLRLMADDFVPLAAYTGLEPATLDGLELDGRVHPSGGLYLDALLPGRHVAVHSELSVGTFGRQGAVAARESVPAGRFQWQGNTTTVRLGLRYYTHLGGEWQLLGGIGAAYDHNWNLRASLRYGDGQPRPVRNDLTVPGSSGFVLPPRATLSGLVFTWPYLEAGLCRGRWNLILDGRLLPKQESVYYDQLVAARIEERNGRVERYAGHSYDAGRAWSVGLTAAFRLTRNADDQP